MPKKIRPKGYRNRARQNRERMAQNSDDSSKVDELIARHVKGPESGIHHGLFKLVDLSWQVDKVTDINQKYNAGLNIEYNLPQTQQSPINAPGRCEKIVGDGNCFFRCISFLLCGSQEYHIHIRHTLLLHMCSFSVLLSSLLAPNVGMAEYIHQSGMSKDKVWATQVEIIAMAHLLKTDIYTYSIYGSKLKWLKHSATFTDSNMQVCDKNIYLDHSSGCHFDVVLSVGPVKSIEQGTYENTMLWSELLRQASRKQYVRNYLQNKIAFEKNAMPPH